MIAIVKSRFILLRDNVDKTGYIVFVWRTRWELVTIVTHREQWRFTIPRSAPFAKICIINKHEKQNPTVTPGVHLIAFMTIQNS